LTASGVLGLAFFAREVNASIAISQVNAKAFAERAAQQHQAFYAAAYEFENREVHEGTRSFAGILRPPRSRNGQPGAQARLVGPPPNETAVVDGVVRTGLGMRLRFEGSRFGYAIAALFGVRAPPPMPFLNGVIAFDPDAGLFQNIALAIVGSVLFAAIGVGALAYFIGRFITQQAIQPLVDVTEALQRFAARDFRPQSITLAGKSDFDVLAHAYNAASVNKSRRRLPSAIRPKRRCVSSSPTRATSCARR
jgi:hypothetical protein